MRFYLWACLALLFACKNSTENTPITFVAHQAEESGIFFENRLTEGPNTNVLMYEYFYNVGDFNADGRLDLEVNNINQAAGMKFCFMPVFF